MKRFAVYTFNRELRVTSFARRLNVAGLEMKIHNIFIVFRGRWQIPGDCAQDREASIKETSITDPRTCRHDPEGLNERTDVQTAEKCRHGPAKYRVWEWRLSIGWNKNEFGATRLKWTRTISIGARTNWGYVTWSSVMKNRVREKRKNH